MNASGASHSLLAYPDVAEEVFAYGVLLVESLQQEERGTQPLHVFHMNQKMPSDDFFRKSFSLGQGIFLGSLE